MKDLFSSISSGYSTFRPTYPLELYDFLQRAVERRSTAWDCATGNGQVATDLVRYFEHVYATDLSTEQLNNARQHSKITYSVSPAEHTTFPDNFFDLITVGQAIHWFDIPEFYREVRRVARPDALLAVWGYGLVRIPTGNSLLEDFYWNLIGPYWEAERKLIDDRLETIPFPFAEIKVPVCDMKFEWSLQQLTGYLNTWSAVKKFIEQKRWNPVSSLITKIEPLWGTGAQVVEFPLFMRCGRVKDV